MFIEGTECSLHSGWSELKHLLTLCELWHLIMLQVLSSCTFPIHCYLPGLVQFHPMNTQLFILMYNQGDPSTDSWNSTFKQLSLLWYFALQIPAALQILCAYTSVSSTQSAMVCSDSSVLYLDSPSLAMCSRNCLQAESQGDYRTDLLCCSSCSDHSPVLPVVQSCLMYFVQFSSCLKQESKSIPFILSQPEIEVFLITYSYIQ